MKNIHVLPTDKTSRLVKGETTGRLLLHDTYGTSTDRNETQNIYITSDEIGKHGEYVHWGKDNESPIKFQRGEYLGAKKIILTTDQDLIKDGVQAIDDYFLEWFVKNPSCERVEVVKDKIFTKYNNQLDLLGSVNIIYKIIIPKEETKQKLPIVNGSYGCNIETNKQEQKRSYSEEDMEIAFGTISTNWICFKEFIEQFKNK